VIWARPSGGSIPRAARRATRRRSRGLPRAGELAGERSRSPQCAASAITMSAPGRYSVRDVPYGARPGYLLVPCAAGHRRPFRRGRRWSGLRSVRCILRELLDRSRPGQEARLVDGPRQRLLSMAMRKSPCGQVQVPAGGQLKVPIPRSSCRPGVQAPGGDGGGAIQSPHRPGASIEVCEGTNGHHRCLS
jgi:hypothetical protein